jgi:hypothetical protein
MFEGQQDSGPVSSRRRTVLKVIGGGAALTTGVVDTGSGREGSSGEEPVSGRDLQDGVTNTVRNAANQIDLSSSPGGWTIRNVGFRGYRSAGTPMVAPAVTNPGGSAVIEGCYFGDGGNGPAIWVAPSHAGELVIRNSYFEGWGDNGVYGSPPGNPSDHPTPGSGGVVRIENCYAKGNATSNFRLGTDGSYVRNCVSFGSQRGYWGFYNSTRVIDCDVGGGIHAGASSWNAAAAVSVENTRFSGGEVLHDDGASISGASQGQPRDYYPGVPLSPTDAKNGALTR